MSLENSRVLHKQFLELGRTDLAEQQEKNYPELKVKEKLPPAVEPNEVKENGKKPKR